MPLNSLRYLIIALLISGCSSVTPFGKNSLKKALAKKDNWNQMAGDQFTMFFQQGSYVSSNKEAIFKQNEEAILKAKSYIGHANFEHITIISLDSRDAIKEIIGRETSGVGLPTSHSVIELHGVSSSSHEKFHVFSINLWGMPKHWISEGMAIACDDQWWSYNLHSLANYLIIENKAYRLDHLIKNNVSFRTKDSRISYPIVGSLVKFIDEKYGRNKLLELWKSGKIESALGVSIQELEKEWKDEVSKFPTQGINYLEKINL